MTDPLAAFVSGAFLGSFLTACYVRNYDSKPNTWERVKEIGQNTVLYTAISVSSFILDARLVVYIHKELKVSDGTAGAILCTSIYGSMRLIHFAATAFPHVFGTPKEACLSFSISTALGFCGLVAASKPPPW